MDHFEVAAKLRILILDGVEAVRAGGDNRLYVVGTAGLAAMARAAPLRAPLLLGSVLLLAPATV